jgi:hypothetical protein
MAGAFPARFVSGGPIVTADILAGFAGILLSLAFSYIPKVSDWYATLTSQYKSLIMLAALAVAALAAFGLSCAGLGDIAGVTLTCDQPGVYVAIRAFVAAAIANQTTYLLSPQKSRQ